jgi:hypothetical protein
MKRSKSSKNQSNKRPRRSLRIGQQQFGPFWTENMNDTPTESSNQSITSSIPDWLNIPFLVWDHQLIKFLGLKQIAIMRGVNRFFEPCWVRRFKLNLLPLRVPYDIGTLDRAMRVIEILIDRKPGIPYSKDNPLVVELDKGEHQIASSWTDPYGINCPTTLSITRSNITFAGKGKDETTILGGFVIENVENITFKNMTVTNTREDGDGIRMSNAKVIVIDVALKGCGFAALYLPRYASETTVVVATRCEFANSQYGAIVCGSLTSAKFNNCVFNENTDEGIYGSSSSAIHLHGEATAIYSNGDFGIYAHASSKVIIHLPSHHNTSYNNTREDRHSSHGGTITNVED